MAKIIAAVSVVCGIKAPGEAGNDIGAHRPDQIAQAVQIIELGGAGHAQCTIVTVKNVANRRGIGKVTVSCRVGAVGNGSQTRGGVPAVTAGRKQSGVRGQDGEIGTAEELIKLIGDDEAVEVSKRGFSPQAGEVWGL